MHKVKENKDEVIICKDHQLKAKLKKIILMFSQ